MHKLEIDRVTVRNIVDDYHSGRLLIPEFQRTYVWAEQRAPMLFDSLFRQYPISTLLFWRTNQDVVARDNSVRAVSKGSLVYWVVDGQQRIKTLHAGIYGEDGLDIVYNPHDDVFHLANATRNKDVENWFRIADIFDNEKYIKIVRSVDSHHAKLEKVRRILDYEIPVVKMVDHGFEETVEAFVRINTQGTKLKSEDIQSAKMASRHASFVAEEITPFIRKIHALGFTRINVMHLFKVCSFLAGIENRKVVPIYEIERQQLKSIWSRVKTATQEATSLIKSEFGLVKMDILWSGALLVPVIGMCALKKAQDRDVPGIAGWLAAAALNHRYSGATETAIDQDLKALLDADPIGKLLSNVRNSSNRIAAEPADFKRTLNDKGTLFALYVACNHRKVVDLFSGAKIAMQDNIDRHHILPRANFPDEVRSRSDTLANIAFLVSAVNRRIGATHPGEYLKNVKRSVLESQCIPLDSDLWSVDRADEFWNARAELLAESFNEFLRERLPKRRIGA